MPIKNGFSMLWSSWPDANGEVRWRCHWTLPPNAIAARVLRASEIRLLSLSGTDKKLHYALPLNQRAAALKLLAMENSHAFVAEGLGYPAFIEEHDIVMTAGSDDLCLVVVEFIGATGQKAPWPDQPDRFAVLRARTSLQPPVPRLQVQFDGSEAVIKAFSNGEGMIDVFAIESADQQKVVDILTPVASIPSGGSIVHTPTSSSGWAGYCARLVEADGRRSRLSRPLWRELR